MLNRKQFLLLSSSGMMFPLTSAVAQGNPPTRTPLPTDGNIAVYMGIKSTWQSLANPGIAATTSEMTADVSAYNLTDTPTRDNLSDHALTTMPLPGSPDWYVFRPTTDTFTLTFDIADANHRLKNIVVTDLLTGAALGSLSALPNGASLTGQLTIPWLQPFYRIDCYDTANKPLFLLAASHGQPDTYVHFTVGGGFQPYCPNTVPSVRFPGGDLIVGPSGDPYNPAGVQVSVQGGGAFSRGCAAQDAVNDSPNANPLQPPAPYLDYIKKKRIETVSPLGYTSNDKADQPSLAADITTAGQEDLTRALSDITAAPYSDNTGHWHAKFFGAATAFFVVPYTVAKQNGLLNFLKQTFGSLSTMLLNPRDKLAFGLANAFTTWLTMDTGKQSGLNAGMVKALGDVKTVTGQEDLKATPISLPLLVDTSITLTPDIMPSGGSGMVTIKNVGFWTTASPPGPANGSTLNLSSPNYTGTLKLPKGCKWEATGNLLSPGGYQQVNPPVAFQTPVANVSIPVTLTVLIQLKVYTNSDKNPAGPFSAMVQLINAAGGVVAKGSSQSQQDGRFVFSAGLLTPGTYTIKADQSNSGGTWTGTASVTIQRGLLQETTVTMAHTPPPHP